MSDIFKSNLKKFLADQISLSDLETITAQEASKNDAQKDNLQHIILQLFSRKIITKSVFDRLYLAVSAPEKVQNQSPREPERAPQASPKIESPPEPIIPFQEALKRFGQRKNTYKDLEKSLRHEVAAKPELIAQYRVILQKLEQKQVLHHSICDQLNTCLNEIEASPGQSTESPNYPPSNEPSSPTATDQDSGPNVDQKPEDSNANGSDIPTSRLDALDSGATIVPILSSYNNRRLSYQDFEDQIVQTAARADVKDTIVAELQAALSGQKLPQIVYDSVIQALLEQFVELKNSPLLDSAADEEQPADAGPQSSESDQIPSAPVEADRESFPVSDEQDDDESAAAGDVDLAQREANTESELGIDDTFDVDDMFADASDADNEQGNEQGKEQNDEPTTSESSPLTSNSESDKQSQTDALDDFPDFDEIVGEGGGDLSENLPSEPDKRVSSDSEIVKSSTEDTLERDAEPSRDDQAALDPAAAPVSDDLADVDSLEKDNIPENTSQNNPQTEDDDKTQIRFSPVKPTAPDDDPDDDDDKTVVQVRKPAGPVPTIEVPAPEPVDDDKTVVQVKKPDFDDDKTVVKVSDRNDVTSTTQEYTSRTSQTSATSTTSATGTSSTWSKPFEAPQEVVEVQIGTVIKGRFRLTEFIGQGGMGDVYKAEDLRRADAGDVETEVAIKVLNNEFKDHPDSLKALQREARKTQSLAHPHIVNVFDFDRDEYHVFMTMELMRGDPLNTAIKKNKRGFGQEKSTKYIRELSTALDYAHRRGIVHSDLKPGNIFLANGEIKVFDFGIARAASNKTDKEEKQDSFDAGSIGALTPSYASPEMLDGVEDADPRDDIYALGCIAYELITGKHPFLKDGKKVPSNVARDENLKPPKITSLKKWQAEALEQCLAFERANRPNTVAEFLDVFLQESVTISNKQKIIRAIGITCLVGASVGGFFYYKSYKISAFEDLVDSQDHAKLFDESEALLLQDRASQQEIFNNPSIRDKFREYLSNRAKQLGLNSQFAEADKIIALARKVYPDSAAISQVANELVDIKNNRKIELYNKLDKLLTEEAYFASNYQELRDVWNAISEIEPGDERLQNTQPVFAFEALIKKLIDQDQYVNAKEVSDYALDFLSQHTVFDEFVPSISRLGNDIQRLQERSLNNERINTLVASLTPISESTTLSALAPFIENIERLNNLDPNNPRLLALQTIVKPLVNNELDKLFTDYKWVEAKALADQYAPVLSKGDLIESQQRIATAQLAWTDTINKLKQDIRVRARQATPESAEQLLPELRSIGASAEELAEMSDAIAQSWILKSRRLQEEQDWASAKAALESAQALLASSKMSETIDAEFANLELAQTQVANQLDRAQREALQAQKIKRIEGFESTINDIVDNQNITQAKLAAFTAAVDSLRIEEPDNNLIASAETKLVNRITQSANQLASSNVDEAISILELGAQFFPSNTDISNLSKQLVTLKQTQIQQQAQSTFANLSSKLDAVIQGSLDANSYDEISTILAEIGRLRGFEQEAGKLAVKAASAFVEKSKTQLNDLRFDEARDTVRYASTIDPSGTNSSELIAQIDRAERQFNNEQLELREQSRIESLRTNLLSRILTMDFERAKEIRGELQAAGGLDRVFTDKVTETFVEKYSERAERAGSEGKFAEAKNWISDAIQEDNSNAELSRLFDLYNTAENIVETSKTNAAVAEQLKQAALSKFGSTSIIADIDVSVEAAPVTPEPIAPVVNQPKPVPVPVPAVQDEPKAQPEPVQPKAAEPVARIRPPSDCLESMAGTGSRTSCRDPLIGNDKGPYLVVLPPLNGESLAISKYEIRVGEYNMYCNNTGDCAAIGGNQLLPVTNLSISDVNKFIDWLSTTTGFTYRLPTEAEWKYAATADRTEEPTIKNCKVYSGTILQYGVKIENINFQRRQTSNGWGVSNYLGNVQELITVSNGYRAIGGHYDDDFSDCEIDRTRGIDGRLDDKTGLRLIREL